MNQMEIRLYSELGDSERGIVHETYNTEWWQCHRPEFGLEDTEEGREIGVKESERQWESAANKFPEGQKILLLKRGGVWIPAYHLRSNLVSVPGLPGLSEWKKLLRQSQRKKDGPRNYPADFLAQLRYPKTWYLASGNGCLDNFSPEGNVMTNFALTFNRNAREKGAREKLLEEQLGMAEERGLYCHTFSPLNNYRDALSGNFLPELLLEKKPFVSEKTPHDEDEEYLVCAFLRLIHSPVGMHTVMIANKKHKGKLQSMYSSDLLNFKRSRVLYILDGARPNPNAENKYAVIAFNGPGIKIENTNWYTQGITPNGRPNPL